MNPIFLIPAFIMLVFIILGILLLFHEQKEDMISKRERTEQKKLLHAVEKLSGSFTYSAKNKTIFKVESICSQAGFSLTYGTFKLISIAFALILPLLVMLVIHVIPLAVISCVGGYILPMQFIRFVRNKRLTKLSKQSGSFLNMITERFKATHDLSSCIISSKKDFEGQEPMYSEILKTEGEMKRSVPAIEALYHMAIRVNSIYLKQFCEYYPIIQQIGINSNTMDIMCEPFRTYEKQRKRNEALEKRIQANVKDNMIMVYAIPIIVIYQSVTNKTYLPFMLGTTAGQIGTTIIVLAVIICVYVLVTKLGAPITDGDD